MTTAYHFVGATLRDGRPVPPDGEWLVHEGSIEMCVSGLHASRRPWHALEYAPGPVLCEVLIDGIADEHDDKLVARRRQIVRRFDATDLLWRFARSEALTVAPLWAMPEIVRRYLETGDESIRAAAWDAAWAAARAAANAGAAANAWDAAWDAAMADAGDAAGTRFDALVAAAWVTA